MGRMMSISNGRRFLHIIFSVGLIIVSHSHHAAAETNPYICAEYTGCRGGSNYTLKQTLYFSEEKVLNQTAGTYRYAPMAYYKQESRLEDIGFSPGENAIQVSLQRDLRTERIATHPDMLLTEFVNSMLGARDPGSGFVSVPLISPSLNFTSSVVAQMRFFSQTIQIGTQSFYLIEFKSQEFSTVIYDDMCPLTGSIRGYALIDTEFRDLYHLIYQFQSDVRFGLNPPVHFDNVLWLYQARSPENEFMPLLDIDHHPRCQEALDVLNPVRNASDLNYESEPPPYLPELVSLSKSALASTALYAEKRTNPLFAAIFGLAHVADAALTLGRNMGHDLYEIIYEGEKEFNPFDGEEESWLEKYFYRKASRGYVETLSDMGVVAKENVEFYTYHAGKIGHSVASIVGSYGISSSVSQFHHLGHVNWGAMQSKPALIQKGHYILGRLSHDAAKLWSLPIMKHTIEPAAHFAEGYKIGDSIGKMIDKHATTSRMKPDYTKATHAGLNPLVYGIGGAAVIGGTAFLLSSSDGGSSSSGSGSLPGGDHGLSDVVVNSRYITITVYDHGQIDGDQIDLIVNGRYYLNDYVLDGPPGKTVDVVLSSGQNRIVIHADNEGYLEPNTAKIVISNVIKGAPSQEWTLGLGEDASFSVSYSTGTSDMQSRLVQFEHTFRLGENTTLATHFARANESAFGNTCLTHHSGNNAFQFGYQYQTINAVRHTTSHVRYTRTGECVSSRVDYRLNVSLMQLQQQAGNRKHLDYVNSADLDLTTQRFRLTPRLSFQPALTLKNTLRNDHALFHCFGSALFSYRLLPEASLEFISRAFYDRQKLNSVFHIFDHENVLGLKIRRQKLNISANLMLDQTYGSQAGYAVSGRYCLSRKFSYAFNCCDSGIFGTFFQNALHFNLNDQVKISLSHSNLNHAIMFALWYQ